MQTLSWAPKLTSEVEPEARSTFETHLLAIKQMANMSADDWEAWRGRVAEQMGWSSAMGCCTVRGEMAGRSSLPSFDDRSGTTLEEPRSDAHVVEAQILAKMDELKAREKGQLEANSVVAWPHTLEHQATRLAAEDAWATVEAQLPPLPAAALAPPAAAKKDSIDESMDMEEEEAGVPPTPPTPAYDGLGGYLPFEPAPAASVRSASG